MRTKIIVDAATNHKGNIGIAKKMIHEAKKAGADCIKFQSWQIKKLAKDLSAKERMKPRELSDEDHHELLNECKKIGIEFLTTCFDIERVDFLASLGLNTIKVASTDVASISMLKKLREKFNHIIISTGMHHPEEIKQAADILKSGNYTLLHCVGIYPCPPEKANLKMMDWLKQFGKVGYSDHTIGTTAAKIAIAKEAKIIEKHFTLEVEKDDIFSVISATPEEIKEIVDFAKDAEKYLGSGNPDITEEEVKSREKFVGRWGNNR